MCKQATCIRIADAKDESFSVHSPQDIQSRLVIPQIYRCIKIRSWCCLYGAALESYIQPHTVFNFLKLPILPKSLCMGDGGGGTTEAQQFQQHTAVLCLYEQFALQRQRPHERCHIHSIHSSFTCWEFCTHAMFLWSLLPPEKSLDTWPSILT